MSLVDHLEGYLGEIESGWAGDADGRPLPFQVVLFPQGPGEDVVTFATLGLSGHTLHSSRTGRDLRHELVMFAPAALRQGPIPGLLQQVALDALEEGHALLRGDVIGPRGPLVPGSSMEALYVTHPVYLPDAFAVYRAAGEPPVVIAWLVPISAPEAAYVERHGWEAFEDRLQDADPDLTDLFRPSILAR